ncbi:hypothetical protein CEUSTIGMA_g9667.t1 [Chlamydomonas eustigma]|uniref:Mitochondrial glycoprotein domain-containing protein n=1 Tax=Chlamydomonas eustigma TaxID=1157962 RepID=A0A250XH45_9CHLO|nr:hypothetical protein CEUSTIGMA_g9667.t1 [Chlamydomonas eustigma]|eukprot:GAX82239.1 hypothetical protein CEUSTIGMA_g9667.t1 [Chlamydomonas eustigma]
MLLRAFSTTPLLNAKSGARKYCLGPTSHHQANKCVRTNASTVTGSLISVLKDEIKYEREYYRKPEELLEAPPNDFEIDNPPGKNSFYLLKEHSKESIEIEVDLDNQPSDQLNDEDEEGETSVLEGEEEMEDNSFVRFKVSVSKGGSALLFVCESDGDTLAINHIAFERKVLSEEEEEEEEEEEDEDGSPDYTGPVFEELDDTLQQAFLDYLEERGVNAELGWYLKMMHEDKLASEYQAWLGKVKDFIAQ